MGLKSFFKKQLATVIEWQPQQSDILIWKYPAATDEIKDASKLIVAPGQGCILVYEGKVNDILNEEGTYSLESDNHPFITNLLKIAQNFESEHKMRLYFFRRAEVVNQGWGTSSTIKYMDSVYKIPVELSAFGNFSYHIEDGGKLLTEYAGSTDQYSTEDFREIIQSRIPQALATYLATQKYSYQEIDSNLNNIAQAALESLNTEFTLCGVELTDFRIEGSNFDDATRERIGKIANMTTEALSATEVGLTYVELEKLRALRDAARNEGGLAGAGLQLGTGMELGKAFNSKVDEITKPVENSDPVTQLQKLKLLLDEQIITQEEFDTKKKDILNRL